MTLRKMLLLASMALAAIAFAAPAAAQADYFTHNGGETVGTGEGNGTHVELSGDITSSLAGLVTTAPIKLTGEVWNDPETGMGEGLIFAEATGPGTVAVPPPLHCTVTVHLPNQPWKLTLTNGSLDLEGVRFINTYNHDCQTAGTPPVGAATGTVTASTANSGANTNVTLGGTQDLHPYNPGTGLHTTTAVTAGLTSNPNPLVLAGVNVEP